MLVDSGRLTHSLVNAVKNRHLEDTACCFGNRLHRQLSFKKIDGGYAFTKVIR